MRTPHVLGILLCILLALPAYAYEAVPRLGRYMPLYPAMYFEGGYSQNEQDRSFNQSGEESDSAVPNLAGNSSFPEKRVDAAFVWHFPMFESQNLPFFSSRTHMFRVNLSHSRLTTEGALADFSADTSDDATTDADDLRSAGSGLGDVVFEFGSFVYGSPAPQWRERETVPFALLAMIGVQLPVGAYDRDAPVNAGSNTFALHARLGAHGQPWSGGFIEAGGGYREYFKNQDPAYGALAPTQQGDDLFWDASFAQRLFGGVYATVYASGREGDPNIYENPRFTPNPPPRPQTVPPSDNFPTPGRYMDQGTSLSSAGVSLQYFLSQRWLASLHYTRPLAGESGEFDLPYTNRQPAGCTVGATGCRSSAGGTTRADGLGPARSFASDQWMLSVNFNFGQGDAFSCTGCKQ